MFDDKVKQSLCKIIKEYGVDIYKKPSRLDGLLKDYCGEYKKEIFMIIAAAKEGIPREINESKVPIELLKPRLVSKIVDNLGFTKEAAEVLIYLWLLALSKITFEEYENSLIVATPKAEQGVGDAKQKIKPLNPLVQTEKQVKAGEYVEFGRYYGEPILWKCVNKDNASVLLVSEYILCQKSFDAAESGTEGEGTSDAKKYGSNVWSNSNIREWLNSSSQTVGFTTQAPVESTVYMGDNAYANEAGFLSNFTQAERDKLKAVSHDGVTDKVFLLSTNEVNSYFGNSDSQRKREITNIGKQKVLYRFDRNNYWWYWTRTPYDGNSVRIVNIDGSIDHTYAYFSDFGVVPALQLSSYLPIKGAGTKDKPWKSKIEPLNLLVQTEKQVKAGEYVEFGRYYGEPILWKCVKENNASELLVSEYILCQKAFDAAESGTKGKGSDKVQKHGSNVWSNSNIREWLNSSSQTVSFTTQAPVKSAVWGGKNAYANEAGFLSNFTQAERDKLKAVSHDGVTDKVFLLSTNEVDSYFGNSDSQRRRKITDIGRQKGEYEFGGDNYWWYWTRTPFADKSYFVRDVGRDGGILSIYGFLGYSGCGYACCSSFGIVPALQLSSYSFHLPIEGAGTKDKPWKF